MSAAPSPRPDTIVRTAIGYMAAEQLFSANRIGVFRALGDGPRTVAEIAGATGVAEATARVLADAMNSLGLLTRERGRYGLTAESAHYLGPDAALDLSPYLHFLGTISLPHWLAFNDATVDSGRPGTLDLSSERWQEFLAGVHGYNALHAAMLAERFDFRPYRRLLDLGGLSPQFAIGALRQNPELTATLVYAPAMAERLEETIAEAGVADRCTVAPAETETATPEGDHDLVLLSHVVHRFGVPENEAILAHARAGATTGATLLVLDFFLDDDDDRQRDLDAMHAGEYFVIDGTIVYPSEQVDGWLTAAGWAPGEMLELPGSPRVRVARAV